MLNVEIKVGKWSLWYSSEVDLQLNDTAIVGDANEMSIALNVPCRDKKSAGEPSLSKTMFRGNMVFNQDSTAPVGSASPVWLPRTEFPGGSS